MKFALAGFMLALLSPALAVDVFRADASLVLINATVLDRHERPVRGLTREEFRVFDEGAEQSIVSFAEDEVPLSLVVVFDESGSMAAKMSNMRQAVNVVLASANTADEFSLVTFANAPQVAAGWNTDAGEIENRLLDDSAHGQTSLLDAVKIGLVCLKKAHNPRQAMVIVSDGGDNHSRSTERAVMRLLAEASVQVYAIDSAEPDALRARSPEEFAGPDLLERLCDRTGGRYFQVDGTRELNVVAEQIARELRSEYVIGYMPSVDATDGRFHRVRVQVERSPKLAVYWRRGYRASRD